LHITTPRLALDGVVIIPFKILIHLIRTGYGLVPYLLRVITLDMINVIVDGFGVGKAISEGL
jgi:hypothetical protein